MQLPQLAIFDMDGLLFDTERLFMNVRAEILTKYGYVHRESDYVRTLGLNGGQLLETLHRIYGPEYPASEISAETRERMDRQIAREGMPVKPGIPELLDYFRSRQVPCCVASSTATATVLGYLRQSGLAPFFSFALGGDQVRRSKPEPDLFLAACRQAGVSPARALVLEDSENGLLAADRAGIPAVCIPDLQVPRGEIAQKAAALLRSAADVPSLFTPPAPSSD